MTIKSYDELDDIHIDVLSELGNIGSGNAATSLSVLLDEGVKISMPHVMILDYDSVVRATGDPEDLGIAIMINYIGDVRGIVLFVLSYDDAKGIAKMLVGDAMAAEAKEAKDAKCECGDCGDCSDRNFGGEGGDLSDIEISMIKEIGNILGSSYLGSISTLTGLEFDISVPHVSIDMVGAIMSAPMSEFSIDNKKILIIEESFSTESLSLKSHVILFADIPSLNLIMDRLGIEV